MENNTVAFFTPPKMKRFLAMLDQYPMLKQYWHIESGKYVIDIEQIRNDIRNISHGEQVLLKFFIAVFTGEKNNGLEFDMIEAAQTLCHCHIDVVRSWLNDPFFP